ncbi:hypothetical protein [Streptomyces sp. RTd22]|nr:hypothetical protein [Streptomyces sp. RTd22]
MRGEVRGLLCRPWSYRGVGVGAPVFAEALRVVTAQAPAEEGW